MYHTPYASHLRGFLWVEYMNGRYQGKRFRSFLLALLALCVGYAFGDPNSFGAFSAAITGLYTAYLAGQSATDWKNGK